MHILMNVHPGENTLTNVLAATDVPEAPSLLIESQYYDMENFSTAKDYIGSNKSLSIFNSNSRSLVKHISQFQLVFDCIHDSEFQFDIITFCETWLDDKLENLTSFQNYTPVFKHKKAMKEGGGLAAFIRKGLKYTVRYDLSFDDSMQDRFDGLFIEIDTLRKNIVLLVIYRTPRFNSVHEMTHQIVEKINIIKNENKDIIIAGDMNIDLLRYSNNNETTEFLDQMLYNTLLPKITLPTRVTETTATLIDHIFTNINNDKCLAGTLLTDISDHFSNFIFIKETPNESYPSATHTYRVINDKNIENLNRSISCYDWSELYETEDANIAYNMFEKTISELIEYHLPTKQIKFNKFKHKINPWMTKGILKSVKTKESLYIKMIKSKQTPSFLNKKEKYKTYNLIFSKCVKLAKDSYWNELFLSTKHDMKKTWQNINKLINKNSQCNQFPESFSDGTCQYKTNVEIANGFNNYFINIGNSLAQDIPDTQTTASDYLLTAPIPNSLFITPTTPDEINEVINKLKPKSSAGHDNISPKLIKKFQKSISLPLTHIVNLSIATGVFPQRMKIAKVIAIHKKGSLQNFENYRPISLLPTFSKILERIIYNRLINFLNSNNILKVEQYGFRKKLSTQHAILELQDRIVKSIAKKEWCSGIMLDLTKAFDTLNHRILIAKLNHIGIRGLASNWFYSYLTDRKQYTFFTDSQSDTKVLSCGVPQGSILGPLLFLIYVNDVVDNLRHSKAILYADDTNLIFNDKDIHTLAEKMNSELATIASWFSANKLSLNLSKTTYIIFHSPNKLVPSHQNINLGQTNIKRAIYSKFLGVTIDEHLDWKCHLDIKAKQIIKVIAILSRLKHSLSKDILKIIYDALILPHIQYAILAWGNVKNKKMSHLLKLQKKAVRLISKGKYNCHTEPLFRKLNLLKIDDIFKLDCIQLYIKNRQNKLPHYLSNQLLTNEHFHSYNTRQTQNIHNLPIRTKLEEQQINTKVSIVYNNLQENIKSKVTSCASIKTIKKEIIAQYQENCNILNCYICAIHTN